VTSPEQSSPQFAAADAIDMSDMAFLTVAETAAVMRVSKMTVYRMCQNGELPAVRVGRGYRIPAKAVREVLSTTVTANEPGATSEK
jgi:excisionase family DNA binding protein